MKLLAMEAVVVVQRRQLSNQQFQLSTETAKSISLGEEFPNLRIESVQAKETLLVRTKEADVMKVERDAIDMRLSQAMLLSSVLQERAMAFEQEVANVVSTSSDGSSTSLYYAPGCSTVTHEQVQKTVAA
jgi:hypothetical protein